MIQRTAPVSLLTIFLLLAISLFSPAAARVQAHLLDAAHDDLLFIHHSVGANWLASGLRDALLAKSAYIHAVNEITYGTPVAPDASRPGSLGSVPGDSTDMNHWILWFNDYLQSVKHAGDSGSFNHIILFKSCFPNSGIGSDGADPGDPFSGEKTLANYQAVYTHPLGSGQVYAYQGYTYRPLEDIFAANPDVLFIAVTAPPLNYGPSDSTSDTDAHRARLFNTWLKTTWLAGYNQAHPGLGNVAVFDLFDILAYPDNAAHPNRLRAEYGGDSGDSHPNDAGNEQLTLAFASGTGNFIDQAWQNYSAPAPLPFSKYRAYIPFLFLP